MKISKPANASIMEDQTEPEDIFNDNITSIETLAAHHIRHHGKHHHKVTTQALHHGNMDVTLCYTTNQVLLIIGLTCVLNLAFIVLIMGCVHFCSNAMSGKIADFTRLDSVIVVDTDSELDELLTPSSNSEEHSKQEPPRTVKYWEKLYKNKSHKSSLSMENLLFV